MEFKENNNFNFTPFPNKIFNPKIDEYQTSYKKQFSSRYNFNKDSNSILYHKKNNNINKYLLIMGINKNNIFNVCSYLSKIEGFEEFINNSEKNIIIIKYKTLHSINLALDYLKNLNKQYSEIFYKLISQDELDGYFLKNNNIDYKNTFLNDYRNIPDEIKDKYYYENENKSKLSKFLDVFFNY